MAADLVGQFLHVGDQPGNMRRRLTGARIGREAAAGIACSRNLATGREDRRERGAALRERRDLVGAGRVIDRTARPVETAGVAIPHRADRPGIWIGRRRGDALRVVSGVGVAGRHDDGHVFRNQGRELAREGRRRRGVDVVAVAQRHVNGDDIVGRLVGDHPVQRRGDARRRAGAAVGQHLEVDDVHARSHPRVDAVRRADDAGDVRAVAVVIAGTVGVGEVVGIDDAVVDAVVVRVGAEEAVVEIDTGIEHDDGDAVAVYAGKARIGAK